MKKPLSVKAQEDLIARIRNADEDMTAEEKRVNWSIEFCHVHMRYGKPNTDDTADYLAIINAPTHEQAIEKYWSLDTAAKEYLMRYIEEN